MGISIALTRTDVVELLTERWLLCHAPAIIFILIQRRRHLREAAPYLLLCLPLLAALLRVLIAPPDPRMPSPVPSEYLLGWLLPTSYLTSLVTGLGVLPTLLSPPSSRRMVALQALTLTIVACAVAIMFVRGQSVLYQPLSFYFGTPLNDHIQLAR